jgi:hypothetical protein
MGTRNLTAVYLDGEPRIAQYGQWDGYPSGQGATVLAFLSKMDRPKFEAALRASHWLTDEEIAAINAGDWHKTHGYLSRDTGAKILGVVHESGGLGLVNRLDFAADSLFCEWAYVIDLDSNVLEVYKGFNTAPVPAGERFANLPKEKPDAEYFPIRLAKAYPLDALPTTEVMQAECDPVEEEA